MTKRKNLKFFLIAFILSITSFLAMNLFQKNLEKFLYAQISQPFEEMVFVDISKKPQKPKLELEAKSAFSLRVDRKDREKILFQKNPEETLPIASLTKLMTAVIVLEDENYDLKKTVIISSQAANQVDVPIHGNLKAGERFNLKQLLDLTLIYSSNDAAFALAEFIGVENFVEKMNQKAKELSLNNTQFVNSTGLDPENQEALNSVNYSTAKDLVKLAQYIFFNHALIFEISLEKGPYLVINGLSGLSLPENLNLIGGKTGYTTEAGGCFLVILQDEKERLFFNLILGAGRETRVGEMQKLINWVNE